MMEEDKLKSRKSWEKKLLSDSETAISPKPPAQENK
jgi:hypothetical protein